MLYLYSQNVHQVRFSYVIVPLVACLALGLALWGILTPLLRGPVAAVVTSLVLLMFHTYGHLFKAMRGFNVGTMVLGRTRYVLLLWLLALGMGIWVVARKRGERMVRGNKVANAFALIMVSMCMAQIVYHKVASGGDSPRVPASAQARQGQDAVSTPAPVTESESAAAGSTAPASLAKPDIYYIIADSYAAARTLKKVYRFDNRPFEDYLEGKGFVVARRSTSNFAFTTLSLASSLNMEMVNHLKDELGKDSKDENTPARMIEDNKVMAKLKAKGYTLVNSGGWWGPTVMNQNADVNIQSGFINEFTLMLIEGSMLNPVADEFAARDLRKKILFAFEKLAEIPKIKEPTFVFAHFLCPHPPFVFGPNGDPLPSMRRIMAKTDPGPLYLGQLEFMNMKLRETVEKILAASETPPIIIIQGDHGPAFIRRNLANSKLLPDTAYLKEQMRIFNAYHLPGVEKEAVYKTISPVNSFRLVFNRYFGENLPMLEDRSYYSTHALPYAFTEVSDVVKRKKALGDSCSAKQEKGAATEPAHASNPLRENLAAWQGG